jgi:hypothetical protein
MQATKKWDVTAALNRNNTEIFCWLQVQYTYNKTHTVQLQLTTWPEHKINCATKWKTKQSERKEKSNLQYLLNNGNSDSSSGIQEKYEQ